ncbi:MAG: MFS transporter [Oscillospiraceae bacterium]|jgi:MFS family permease|nr:MFS transporter [Oscillospiraceae bacterium]
MAQSSRFRKPKLALYDSPGLSDSLRKSLNFIIISGAFGTVSGNITGGAAWTGFLRAIGANAAALGIFAAIPVAANSIQILISYIIERTGHRREWMLRIGIAGRLLWAVIGLIPFIIPMEAAMLRIVTAMVFVALCAGSNAVISVSFYSLIGDLVPIRMRGRYFGVRQMFCLVAGVLTGLGVSMLLDRMHGYAGYMVALLIAGIFGGADIALFVFCDWPTMHLPEGKRDSLGRMLLTVALNKRFRKITLIMLYWGFAVNICAPFYNVYMLEVIGMTYTQITLINQVLPNVITVFIISWWGRRMDTHGNKPVMQFTGLFTMIYPLLWMFTGPNVFWILIITNIASGLLSTAFDLGAQNMYLNAAPDVNRSMYISVYFAATQLLGNATSNALGGILVQNVLPQLESLNWHIGGLMMTRYHFIYLISGILRIIMILCLLPMMQEDECKTVRALVTDSSTEIRTACARKTQMLVMTVKRRRARRALRDDDQQP